MAWTDVPDERTEFPEFRDSSCSIRASFAANAPTLRKHYHLDQVQQRIHQSRYANSVIPYAAWRPSKRATPNQLGSALLEGRQATETAWCGAGWFRPGARR